MNTQELKQLQLILREFSEKVEKALSEKQPTIQPFEGTKRVRITSADVLRWYKLPIGNEYDVKYHSENTYVTVDHKYVIDYKHCVEVEPQPQQPWEKYPTFESCRGNEETEGYIIASNKGVIMPSLYRYGFPTEALAKYSRAVMILSTVAKKWNEGVDIVDEYGYIANIMMKPEVWHTERNILPFFFHSQRACEKSIELFPEEWKDFFNAKG